MTKELCAGTTATPAEEDAAPPADDVGTTPAGDGTAVPSGGTPAPAGTTLVCGDYGVGEGSADNLIDNCPEDTSTRCLFRTCEDDPSLTQKCQPLPTDFSVIDDKTLPADVECVVLQNDGTATDTPAAGTATPMHAPAPVITTVSLADR